MQLDRDFRRDAQAALLDRAEERVLDGANPLVRQAIDRSHEILRSVGAAEDYDVEPVIDSAGEIERVRTEDRLTVRWGWEHEAAPFFEFGTDPHTVEGDPVLAFRWEDAPPEVQEQFEDTFPLVFFQSVDVDGIAEAAFVMRGVEFLRQQIES